MIIDEAQRFPELFSYLQVLVDEDRMSGNKQRKFIVTGSANFALKQQISQSMAGRTAVLTLLPLSTTEQKTHIRTATTDEHIIRGGYPAIWTNDDDGREMLLSNYYTTYMFFLLHTYVRTYFVNVKKVATIFNSEITIR